MGNKVLVIGSSGFLGTKIISILSKDFTVLEASNNLEDPSKMLDATDAKQVEEFVLRLKPDVVIDTVALTSSLACEKDPALAKKLNYETAINILNAAKKINAKLIFISSSYVFDGEKGDYSEEDETNPLNIYGKTKVLAEKEILSYAKGIVLRVDIMYGFNDFNKGNGVFSQFLSDKIVELRDPNQLRQPILVDDVVFFIKKLINTDRVGLFHIAGRERLKIKNFFELLEGVSRKESKIKVVKDSPAIIMTPKNSTMNISKMLSLGSEIHSLEEGINILNSQFVSKRHK